MFIICIFAYFINLILIHRLVLTRDMASPRGQLSVSNRTCKSTYESMTNGAVTDINESIWNTGVNFI